jgi:hypothetical protein
VIQGSVALPWGMVARPARSGDREFLAKMARENRGDLRCVNAAPEYIEMVIELQLRAQTIGYGNTFPNALYLVIERLGTRIGCLTLDIGTLEMRLVNLDFIKKARSRKHRQGILLWLMSAAAQTRRPLVVACRRDHAPFARFLQSYGFVPDPSRSDAVYWRMTWRASAEERSLGPQRRPQGLAPLYS